jgi:hypothetical protein
MLAAKIARHLGRREVPMVGSEQLLRGWIVASILWLTVPGYCLVTNWQKISPPSATCRDFAKRTIVAAKASSFSQHTISCINEANSANVPLIANFLKLAAVPPVFLFSLGWVALGIGRAFRGSK